MIEVGFELISIVFIGILALLELLGWELVAYQFSTWCFYLITVLIVISVIVLLIHMIKREKICIRLTINSYMMILFVEIIFTIVMLSLFYKSDADDSFYVSNVALFAKSNTINPYDSSFGIQGTSTVSMYDFQIWESFLSVFVKVFGINAAVLCHGILPTFLLIVSMSAYYFLGKVLFTDDKKSYLFTFIVLVLNLLGGYSLHSNGRFLLSRLWQGKSVYLHIVLPVMIGVIVDKRAQMSKWYPWIIASCVLAGVGLNPTSLYILGFQVLFMLIALALSEKNGKRLLSGIPSFVVIAYFTGRIWLRTRNNVEQLENASSVGKRFVWNSFKDFIDSGWIYFWLFIVAALFVLLKGTKEAKVVCVYVPALAFITIANGVTGVFVAKHITMAPAYWRVFWLIPIEITLAYAYIRLMEILERGTYRRYIITIIMSALLVIPGKFIFSETYGFVRMENFEGMPTEVLDIGAYIDKEINNGSGNVVLGSEKYSTTLRQVYTNQELLCSRYQYILDVFQYKGLYESASDRILMWQFMNSSLVVDSERLDHVLTDYDVKWIIVDCGNIDKLDAFRSLGYKQCYESHGDVLLTR